jgi:membrane-associated phospholipid phosphatase
LLLLTRIIKAILQLPFMQRLKARYPRSFDFIRNRFDPGEFLGLPLTILLFLVWVNLAMFSELAEGIVDSRAMKNVDMEVTAWFFNLRTPFLSQVAYYFTLLGTTMGITVTTAILGLVLLWKKRPYHLLALLVSVLGSGLSSRLTKIYFQRERPLNFAYYLQETYSFPSGHATSAMALMGILCYFIFLEVENKQARWALFLASALYTLLMGFSRIYLGVHFLSDIAAGYLLGIMWVLMAIGLMEFAALKKGKEKNQAQATRQAE